MNEFTVKPIFRIAYLALPVLLAACSGGGDRTPPAPVSVSRVQQLQYRIAAILPHDTAVFTEGLELHDSVMYESAGNYGASALIAYRPRDGKVLVKRSLDKVYFGEGISILGDRIYQMTYKEHAFFVYHFPDLTLVKAGEWAHEGWGMTNDGQHLIASDGTDKLYVIDPATLREIGQISVTDDNVPLDKINELEYADGEIYANRWHTNLIYRIDAHTGKVDGVIDVGDLFRQTGIAYHPSDEEDVLNGIARSGDGTLYVTGKRWPKIFALKLY
jgi:glutamine cyclotransferase